MARIEEQKTVWGCEVNRAGWLHGTTRRARHFARDEDGAMFFLALLLFVFMLGFSGLATDLMKADGYRSQIQYTMDRALLAAAHPDQKNDRKAVVLDYFDRAGLSHFIDEDNVHVQVAADGTKVFAQSSISVPTPFLSFFGVDHVEAQASGGAAKVNQLTEVSLVVDVSGSMGNNSTTGNTKIKELRDAAIQFSNLLLCDPNDPTKETDCTITNRKTSISLVPYSTQVNVGASILSKYDRQDAQANAYCADFLDTDFKAVGVAPSVDMINTPHLALRQAGKFYRYGGNYKSTSSDAYLSCHTDSWREVVAFEDNAAQLNSRIRALKAEGDTAIDIGMKWGTTLLNHMAQPVISGLITDGLVHSDFSGRPFNPNSTASSKFVVLMTDGQNTNHHHLFDGYRTGPSPFWLNSYPKHEPWHQPWNIISVYRASHDDYTWFYPATGETKIKMDHPFGENGRADCFYSYYHGNKCTPTSVNLVERTRRLDWSTFWAHKYTWGFVQRFPWLGTPGRLISNGNDLDGNGTRDIDQRLLDQCDAAKNAGITIYTIEMETPNTATNAMQQCASVKGGQRLHYKVSGLDMSAVFNKIAEDINRLRLIN
ncbi:pilus assembly protein TadG-related protein [Aliiroseovarius marinus]|uniref:pilus assembly protein TadG-related protein n=1 Tax=Aliiroseovarius marinus TaxID=2500159 RepID=UPI003D7CCF65